MRQDQRKWMIKMGLAWSAGLVLVFSIAIGYFFGSWLDRRFGTDPWLMLLFTLLGIAAGFIELYRIARQIASDD